MQAISSKIDHLDSHSESNFFRSPNTTPIHHSVLEDLPSGYWDISQPSYNQQQQQQHYRQQHMNIYNNPEPSLYKTKPIEHNQSLPFGFTSSAPRPIVQTPIAYAQSPQGYFQIPVDPALMNILIAQSKHMSPYSPMVSYMPLSGSAPAMVSVPINLAIPTSSASAPRAPVKIDTITKKALHVRRPKSQNSSPLSTSPATSPGTVKRARKVRPKVQATKGSMQCHGINRKKGCQCKNAALMEYFGPRPLYCAEHIDQDPLCYYTKCKSSYQKTPGDGKGCREVVLKEFEYCHKHFHMYTCTMQGADALEFCVERLHRVEDLLHQLEQEAAQAKKTDADLYQRKNKLIPKFTEMKMLLLKRASELSGGQGIDLTRPQRVEAAAAPLTPASLVSSPSDNCADDINAESQETYEGSLESDNDSLEDVFATANEMDSPDCAIGTHVHNNIDLWTVDEHPAAREDSGHFVY